MRRLTFGLALLAGLALAPSARAQQEPIVDLLLRARTALNDLHYTEADSLASAVLLAMGGRLSHDQRVEALTIRAAALFPDPTGGGAQHPDSALACLRQIVRADAAVQHMNPDLSWRGLDSLFSVARRTTFAAAVLVQDSMVLVGQHGEATVEVVGTRPGSFSLSLAPAAGGAAAFADSAGPGDSAQLHLRAFGGDRLLIPSGAYVLTVRATDAATRDTVVMRYAATVSAPPPLGALVLPVFDSTQLRPEFAGPAHARGFIAGLLAGGGAVLAATLKGPGPLASASTDSRSYMVGGGMALGAIIGGLLDKGHALPENAAANQRLRTQFDESVRGVRAEYQLRLNAYRVTITIRREHP